MHQRAIPFRLLSLALLATLPGCTQFPELDREISAEARAAPAPELTEIGPLLSAQPVSRADGVESSVTARSEALQARGAALSGQQSDPERDALIEARRQRLMEERQRLSPRAPAAEAQSARRVAPPDGTG